MTVIVLLRIVRLIFLQASGSPVGLQWAANKENVPENTFANPQFYDENVVWLYFTH